MKKGIICMALLASASFVYAQQKPTMEMKPEMTEIWEPEVKIISPGGLQAFTIGAWFL